MARKALLVISLLAGIAPASAAIAETFQSTPVGGLVTNAADTPEEFWMAVERGESSALQRLNDLASGGVIVRKGNAIINRVTGQITSTIGRQIDDALDTAFSPIEDAVDSVGQTISCNFGGAILGAAAGAVSAVFSGGKSTYGAQVSQLLQQGASNLCQGKQLATAKRQLADLERMNAGSGITTEDGEVAAQGMLPGLAYVGFLSPEKEIGNAYVETYPPMFPDMTDEDLRAASEAMRQHERESNLKALTFQNRTIQEQWTGLARARSYAAQGRDGKGIRAELQAMNAIGGEQIAAINGLTAATAAEHRARIEEQLRQESAREVTKAADDNFMATLGQCPACGQHAINLFGGARDGVAGLGSGATANDVFGTGIK